MNYDGLLKCINYSYPPNSLQYCGPDKTEAIIAYKQENIGSDELVSFMKDFHTLYVYLRFIAYENNIKDPFDPHVVEAYWIGNPLLTTVSMKGFWKCLVEDHMLKKRLKQNDLRWLMGKIPQGAVPHHTFHVLNVFTRTGHHTVEHTLETMDACRISWGKVINQQKRNAYCCNRSQSHLHPCFQSIINPLIYCPALCLSNKACSKKNVCIH